MDMIEYLRDSVNGTLLVEKCADGKSRLAIQTAGVIETRPLTAKELSSVAVAINNLRAGNFEDCTIGNGRMPKWR